jgi:hypothetical protein
MQPPSNTWMTKLSQVSIGVEPTKLAMETALPLSVMVALAQAAKGLQKLKFHASKAIS